MLLPLIMEYSFHTCKGQHNWKDNLQITRYDASVTYITRQHEATLAMEASQFSH